MSNCEYCATHQLLEEYVTFFRLNATNQVLRQETGDRENKTRKLSPEEEEVEEEARADRASSCPWHAKYVQQEWKLCHEAFTRGDDEAFFNLWELFGVKEEGKALEFNLRLYFALYPELTNEEVSTKKERVKRFQAFLENRGYDYSSDPQWTMYFALPFVAEPAKHPSFQHLYEDEWRAHLSQQLTAMWQLRATHLTTPHQAEKLLARNLKLEKHIKELKEECRQLIEMASDLASALEKSVQGDFENLEHLLIEWGQKSPSVFAEQIRALTATKRNKCSLGKENESGWRWRALTKSCSIASIDSDDHEDKLRSKSPELQLPGLPHH